MVGQQTHEEVTDDACLVGELASWPLSEVLLWLSNSERTAMIRVGQGLEAGVLFVDQGKLFRCEWGQLSGEAALFGLLAQTVGTFTLIQRHPPKARTNIQRPTLELLHAFALYVDEQRRGHVA